MLKEQEFTDQIVKESKRIGNDTFSALVVAEQLDLLGNTPAKNWAKSNWYYLIHKVTQELATKYGILYVKSTGGAQELPFFYIDRDSSKRESYVENYLETEKHPTLDVDFWIRSKSEAIEERRGETYREVDVEKTKRKQASEDYRYKFNRLFDGGYTYLEVVQEADIGTRDTLMWDVLEGVAKECDVFNSEGNEGFLCHH